MAKARTGGEQDLKVTGRFKVKGAGDLLDIHRMCFPTRKTGLLSEMDLSANDYRAYRIAQLFREISE